MKKISLLLALVLLIGVLSATLCLSASAVADAPAAMSETAAEAEALADGSLSPETGDFTLASIALVITAAIGIILFFKKRKDTDL